MKKMISALLVLVLCLTLCASCLADAAVTGRYVSTQNVGFMSAYPQYTFKMATFGVQYLELLDDGTYRLVDTETMYSGSLTFSDDGTYEVVPRGNEVRVYTGTCEALSDSGLLMVTLSAPATFDLVSTNSIANMGGDQAAPTQEELMAKYGFEEVEIMIDEATGEFDYIVVGAAE